MNRSSTRRATIPLREKQREAVTEAILDAAEAVIEEQGVASAPMVEIARRAGVAVGTVYNYFPDRDGLVHALFEQRRAAIIPQIRAALAAHRDEPFEPALRGFLRDVLTAMEAQRRYVRLAFELDPPKIKTKRERPLQIALHGALNELLAKGPRGADRIELQTRVLGGALRAVMIGALERDVPFVTDLDAMLDLVLDGLRGRGGKR